MPSSQQVLHLRSLPGALLTALLLQAGNSLAQWDDEAQTLSQFYGDEAMISIATGSEKPIAKAPAVASVISAQDILRMGASDIDEVLEAIPGLHVARDPISYNPIYTFRGIYAAYNPQVLMLINGIPLTNLFQGDRNIVWGGMPVRAIERIEVIRGPGSAVYGADAFAGVINIITKTADDIDSTEIGASIGSFRSRDGWLLHKTQWAEFDIALIVERHTTDGQREIISADAQTVMDQLTGTSVSLAPGPVNLSRDNLDLRLDIAREHWRLRAGLQQRDNIGSGAGGAQALDPGSRYQSSRRNIDLSYHNASAMKHWDIAAELSMLETSQESDHPLMLFPPGSDFFFGLFDQGVIGSPEVWERHYRGNASAFYRGMTSHEWRIGGGYYFGDLYKVREQKNYRIDTATGLLIPLGAVIDVSNTGDVFLPEASRENSYLFVQDQWQLANDWELTSGLRHDHYSDFGSTTNPRMALVWSARHNTTLKLLYGQAFRAPAFAQTRNINNPIALGNPQLDPETIESLELAIDYRHSEPWQIGANIYQYYWDDMILFTPDPGGSHTARNAGEQRGYGLELELQWLPSANLTLHANLAWQRAEDETLHHDAGNAPQEQLYIRSDWAFAPFWQMTTQLNWVMSRERVKGDLRTPVKDYQRVDINLRHEPPASHWRLALTVKNLFDRDCREPSSMGDVTALIPNDLPLAGRAWQASLSYQF